MGWKGKCMVGVCTNWRTHEQYVIKITSNNQAALLASRVYALISPKKIGVTLNKFMWISVVFSLQITQFVHFVDSWYERYAVDDHNLRTSYRKFVLLHDRSRIRLRLFAGFGSGSGRGVFSHVPPLPLPVVTLILNAAQERCLCIEIGFIP